MPIAQELRKNITPEKDHLWYNFLKKLPVTVNRQKNIGDCTVDFYVSKANIVIELDGSQHGREENKKADARRDSKLRQPGIKV